MKRKEKLTYVPKENSTKFDLGTEQDNVKYAVMQEFVRLRKERGVTQSDLAEATGIARPNIARMENGSYNPTIDMMVRLAAGIGMRLEINWVEPK